MKSLEQKAATGTSNDDDSSGKGDPTKGASTAWAWGVERVLTLVGQVSHIILHLRCEEVALLGDCEAPVKDVLLKSGIKTITLFSRCTRFRTSISRGSRKTSPQRMRRCSSGGAVLQKFI